MRFIFPFPAELPRMRIAHARTKTAPLPVLTGLQRWLCRLGERGRASSDGRSQEGGKRWRRQRLTIGGLGWGSKVPGGGHEERCREQGRHAARGCTALSQHAGSAAGAVGILNDLGLGAAFCLRRGTGMAGRGLFSSDRRSSPLFGSVVLGRAHHGSGRRCLEQQCHDQQDDDVCFPTHPGEFQTGV